jgi:hypothetical protein
MYINFSIVIKSDNSARAEQCGGVNDCSVIKGSYRYREGSYRYREATTHEHKQDREKLIVGDSPGAFILDEHQG